MTDKLRHAALEALDALETSQRYVEASADRTLLRGWSAQLDRAEVAITALREALADPAEAPAAVAPPGWKLVPLEPTDDMIVDFAEAWYAQRQVIDDPQMVEAYRAMLAAAPNPPAQRSET